MLKDTLKVLTIALFSTVFMVGCDDGPAEETGEKIDEVVTDTKNAVEDACEKTKEELGTEETNC